MNLLNVEHHVSTCSCVLKVSIALIEVDDFQGTVLQVKFVDVLGRGGDLVLTSGCSMDW